MKKFIISTEALSKALHKLSYAVNPKTIVPALSNIYCKVTSQSIEFITSDTEITIHYRCVCETSGEGFEFLLPFQLISKIVALNKRMPLTFSMEKKGIKITGDTDAYELKSLEKIENFPALQELPKKTKMQLNAEFIPWLATAVETVSKDETNKPNLTKVLLELRQKEITIASTDGAYMVFSYSMPLQSPEDDEILISPKAIKAIEGMKETTLYWHKKIFAFESEEITVIVTRPDMKFANFRGIFPQDFNSNLTFNREDLINALEKCNISSDPFKTTVLNLKQTAGKVSFEAIDTNYGININVALDGDYQGNVEQIKLNSDKMLKLLNQVNYDQIELAIHQPNKAVLLRSADDKSYLGLLMPIFNKE